MTKKLTEAEHALIEKNHLQKKLCEKDEEILQYKLQHINNQKHILELQSRLLESQKQQISEERKAIEHNKSQADQAKNDHMDAVRERLGLSGRIGFNPDTLEVLDENGDTVSDDEEEEQEIAAKPANQTLPGAKNEKTQ